MVDFVDVLVEERVMAEPEGEREGGRDRWREVERGRGREREKEGRRGKEGRREREAEG